MSTFKKVRRVFVVEDQPDTAESFVDMIELMGHQVDYATTADLALQKIVQFKPDVVFLDLALPDAEGHELARELRELPGLRDVRIFAVTGYDGDVERRRSREAGLDGHFVKPLDAQFVQELLEKHV